SFRADSYTVGLSKSKRMSSCPVSLHAYFSHCMLPKIKQAVTGRAVCLLKRFGVQCTSYHLTRYQNTKDLHSHLIQNSRRLEILNKASLTVLHIRHGVREHSGQYSVTASNSAGKDTTTIMVVVLDKPDPPTGPVRIDEVNSDYVIMSWDPPSYTGGCHSLLTGWSKKCLCAPNVPHPQV
uniref:Immunoglobulin I-set domain-containing protein n=1 Tax=Poecilia latipinna TaxID=48699 RepID=A0A3B3UA32_9TELE